MWNNSSYSESWRKWAAVPHRIEALNIGLSSGSFVFVPSDEEVNIEHEKEENITFQGLHRVPQAHHLDERSPGVAVVDKSRDGVHRRG